MPLSASDIERAERALKRSIFKRDQIVTQFNILSDLVNKVENDVSVIPVLNARKKDLESLISDFRLDQDDILTQLITLERDSEFSATHASIGNKILEQYYFINASFSTLGLDELLVPKSTVNTSINLPNIKLPSFDGDILQWRSFHDTFASLVHTNTQLSPIQKYHYLLSSVTGSAAAIVKSLPISSDNYPIVWNTLITRFDNKRALLNAHLDILFQFVPQKTESLIELKHFLNTFQENIAAIKALDVDDFAGFILFYIASKVLNTTTRRLFEFEYHDAAIPTFDMLADFVQIRCRVLQNSSSTHILLAKPNDGQKKYVKPTLSVMTASSSNSLTCVMCHKSHSLYQCQKFINQNVKQRFRFARTNRLCMNCLSTLHKTSECSSAHTCRYCTSKHHSLLHLDTRSSNSATKNSSGAHNNTSTPTAEIASSSHIKDTSFVGTSCSNTNVVLATALMRIRDCCGNWSIIRVLIDPGSQISVITNACVTRLGIKRSHCSSTVTGLSQTPVSNTKGLITCTLTPYNSSSPEICVKPIILSRITGQMPNVPLKPEVRATYGHLNLADPHFDIPGNIDFLLGADRYSHILGQSCKVLHNSGLPSAYETLFGWIILGQAVSSTPTTSVSLLLTSEPSVDTLIKRFWEIEEPVLKNKFFTTDEQCEDHFTRTTTRDESGRFSVSLPFKLDSSLLGTSREMAVSRFLNLERKLIKDPIVYEKYRSFMREYETLGHMKFSTHVGKYYIPHHAVVKQNEKDPKLRVVFDASAVSSSGKSLNDILHTGPKLQSDISDLLICCRFYKYMFTADICKMYRQININPDDCQYQHIVWRPNISEPIKNYELKTITYGVTSSPFQAIRILHQLEHDDGHLYPYASNILSTQTYVDDILTGDNTVHAILQRQKDVIQLLLRAGFELKKWSSNCKEVLQNIPVHDQLTKLSFDPKDDTTIKILGLHWNPVGDQLTYHTTSIPLITTKRSILSTIAKLYDPIGALGPIIFWAKCFMQSLWKANLQWDDPLPEILAESWLQFSAELPLVSKIKIDRYICSPHHNTIQLIGFSDASEKGYAAVVYFRIVDTDGNVSVHFATSKSKVAPLKTQKVDMSLTIPRLELCGALLLAQMIHRLMNTVKHILTISEIYLWTDSQVVLSWLTTSQSVFKIFVTNRLAKIKELVPNAQWNYITSTLNSADCVSRGLFPSQAVNHELYWYGPPFLKTPECDWPILNYQILLPSQLPDFKPNSLTTLTIVQDDDNEWFSRFSSFIRLQRVTVHIQRFLLRTRKLPCPLGPLTYKELQNAIIPIIKTTQRQHFATLFTVLQFSTGKISPRSLAQLSPFLDKDNIIRVGGRLRHAKVPLDTQHPILLPKTSTLTTLLIRHFHLTYLHAGPQLTSTLLSRKYWILSSRPAIRSIIFKCIVCARHRANAPQPIMADLPISRVTPSRPFLHVGIDFAGPLMVKESRRKNARATKSYLAVFVCMTIKAVHLELVTDLSTNAFMAALHRFVARRGIPSDIYTDCGTNFKGANQQLRNLLSDPTTQNTYANAIACTWHFNPPAAPHFGGIWEAAVKSTKHHLKRVVGTQILTFEEMTTLLARVEAILNSRPLVPQSSDPNDYRSLSPGDFLIGQPLVDIPEQDVTSITKNKLTRWELLRQLYQSFWKRWSTEYITTLQRRTKWVTSQPNIEIDDLVLVNVPNQPPTHWILGRIQEVHPGDDGVVRVVTIRTPTGITKRPVSKIAILPIDKTP